MQVWSLYVSPWNEHCKYGNRCTKETKWNSSVKYYIFENNLKELDSKIKEIEERIEKFSDIEK